MTKIKLGNDFTNEDESDKTHIEESDEKTTVDETVNEKDNSADTDDSKKDPEKTDKESIDEDESVESKDDSKDESEDNKKAPDDKQILQGLLETEKSLDGDVNTIDEAIVAARKRISAKRGERRDKRDLVDSIDERIPVTEEDIDDLSDIDSETLKVLDRYTKSKGLVPKSELAKMSYQQQHKNAEESFYEKHPEYLPENDSDDVLYKAIKKELTFFATPSDAKLIPKLFEKAHNEVIKLYPDKFKERKNAEYNSDKDTNKNVRIKTLGLGGKSSGGGDSGTKDKTDGSKKIYNSAQIRALQDGGWTEDEIKELTNK